MLLLLNKFNNIFQFLSFFLLFSFFFLYIGIIGGARNKLIAFITEKT
jgi:hypothetical protein